MKIIKTISVFFKRWLDLIFSMLFITFILSWLTPLLTIILKLINSGPVFIKRSVVGRNGKGFDIFSFRYLERHQITKTKGFMLVKNSPRLFNILFGDISTLEFIRTYNQSDMILANQSKMINSVDYLNSLKYILPKKVRLELSDLYFQIIDDLKCMKEDMLEKTLPLWWINIILKLNVFSVIICVLYDYLKKILEDISIIKFK
jgi:Bacterial sugar transferase